MRRFTIILTCMLALMGLLWARSANAEATFVCQPGATYMLKGTGPADTALLLLFNEHPVGGGTSDANGAYRLRLTIGQEPPGAYPILVEVRGSHQRVISATCIIPAPATVESGAVAGPAGTTAPIARSGAQPTSAAAATLTATLSPSPNPSTTAAAQTSVAVNGTSTATTTGTTTATTSTSDTRATATTGTVTATTTGTTATATPSATVSPTVSSTDTGSDEDQPEITIDPDDTEPSVGNDGDELTLSGEASDSQGDEVVNTDVTITYRYDNADQGTWCTAKTDEDGSWECPHSIDAALQGKVITFTVSIVINGKTYQATSDEVTPQEGT